MTTPQFLLAALFILTPLLGAAQPAGDGPTFDDAVIQAKGEMVIRPVRFDHLEYCLHTLPPPVGPAAIQILFQRPRENDFALSLNAKAMPRMPYFDFNSYVPKGQWGIFRLGFSIVAPAPTELIVLTDGRLYQQLVCNGERAPLRFSDSWIEKYGVAQRIHLGQGANRLEFWLAGYKGRCSFSLALATVERGEAIARENWIATALNQYIYRPGETLRTNDWSFAGPIKSLAVREPSGIATRCESARYVFRNPGVYSLSLGTASGKSVDERVAVLDEDLINGKVAAVRQSLASGPRSADFDIFAARLEFLMDPAKRRIERFIGDRDLIEMLIELDDISQKLAADPTCDWVVLPGRHFGTYASGLQPSPTPYMIYLPQGSRRPKPAGLVVVMPAASRTRPKFSESYAIDYRGLVQSFLAAADRHNLAVLWPYAANEIHTRRTELRVDECVDAVTRRCHIPRGAVFAIGSCGGARDLLMFAARQRPDLSAAAAHEVIFDSDSDETPRQLRLKDRSTPLDVIGVLKGIPLFLSHGELDRHVPASTTEMLYSRLVATGAKPEIDIIAGADEAYYPRKNDQWIDAAFAFFGSRQPAIAGEAVRPGDAKKPL